MCLTPIRLPSQVYVKCKTCRICKGNRVNDWAGRCVAEQQGSSSVVSITLTYASVEEGLTLDDLYPDVQRMLKRLRKAGYSVRYLCCGEYGELKGRPHWHIIFFFRGKAPEVDRNTKFFNWKFWPHGYSFVQAPDFDGICYVLKYTMKDDNRQSRAIKRIYMSKYPPIGYDFFQLLADRYVKARLPVQSPEYAFANVRDKKNRVRTFWLFDRSRELFISAYVSKWREAYGTEPPMHPFLVEEYYDPMAKEELEVEFMRKWFADAEANTDMRYLLLPAPTLGIVVKCRNRTARYYRDGLPDGEEPCRLVIGDEFGSVAKSVAAWGIPAALVARITQWLRVFDSPYPAL